jgi:hypothetical protein
LEKEQFLIEKYSKWMSGDITRQQFVFAVSYKNQPLAGKLALLIIFYWRF